MRWLRLPCALQVCRESSKHRPLLRRNERPQPSEEAPMTKACRLRVRMSSHTGPRWKHWATNHGDEKESDAWIAQAELAEHHHWKVPGTY